MQTKVDVKLKNSQLFYCVHAFFYSQLVTCSNTISCSRSNTISCASQPWKKEMRNETI